MPNWCENTLKLVGSKSDIEKFHEENTIVLEKHGVKKAVLSFEKSVPANGKIDVEEVRKRNPDMKCLPDWYLEQREAWGCKWDVGADDCTISNDFSRYSFATPWSPPYAWLRTIGMLYPTLKFTLDYDEPAMDYIGTMSVEGMSFEDTFV